jgi:N-acetylglutamate synthase-like GNAT family acetyltransferase
MKSNSNSTIRKYEATDHEACMEAFKTNVPLYFTIGEIGDFECFLNRLEDPGQENNPPYYVLELDGKVIGCGGFGDKDGTGAITFVWGLVHNDYHKQGFGEQLLVFRLAEIKLQFPEKQIILDTTQHSFSFFEKYGFETVKFTPDFYAEGMHRYDMVYNPK